MRFTERQREVLHRRLAREFGWDGLVQWQKDNANKAARIALDELEEASASAGAQRRAVDALVASLDEVAPGSSVFPAEEGRPRGAMNGAGVSPGATS